MISERNGVIFFKPGEKYPEHPAFKALSVVSLGDVRFPFGFFLREEKGKWHVVPGTEEDRRKALLKAHPDIHPEALRAPCAPFQGEDCIGHCDSLPSTHACMLLYDPPIQYYSCGCMPIV